MSVDDNRPIADGEPVPGSASAQPIPARTAFARGVWLPVLTETLDRCVRRMKTAEQDGRQSHLEDCCDRLANLFGDEAHTRLVVEYYEDVTARAGEKEASRRRRLLQNRVVAAGLDTPFERCRLALSMMTGDFGDDAFVDGLAERLDRLELRYRRS